MEVVGGLLIWADISDMVKQKRHFPHYPGHRFNFRKGKKRCQAMLLNAEQLQVEEQQRIADR